MTEARLSDHGGIYRVRVVGHAESGPKGADIVCAAVSSLVLAYASYVQDAEGVTVDTFRVDSGDVEIRCSGNMDKLQPAFDMLLAGLMGIESSHEKNLKVFLYG